MKRIIYLILGFITTFLGIIGIIIPIIPTTPFLLLSAFFFLRSSQKLYNWLLNHKVLGKYIYNYMPYKAIPKKAKIAAITLIVVGISITLILVDNLIVYITLPIIATIVSIYIIRIKTLEIKWEIKNIQFWVGCFFLPVAYLILLVIF